MRMSEKELLELLINKYNYPELEEMLNNKHFVDKGFLKKGSHSYNSFIKRVNSICESFERTKRHGQPAYYELINIKEVADELQDDRVNNGLTDDDIIMFKHFYNVITSNNFNLAYPRSYYQWGTDTGGINPTLLDDDTLSKLSDTYYFSCDKGEIYNGFNKYIKNRNKRIGENAINWLRRNGYIRTVEHYYATDIDNNTMKIDVDTYTQFNKQIQDVLTPYKLKIYNYHEIISSREFAERNTDIYFELDSVYEQFQMKKAWKSFQIFTLKNEKFEVTRSDYKQAYHNKMMDLLVNPKNPRKVEEDSFNDVFFVFNITYLLKHSFKIEHEKINTYLENNIPAEFAREIVLVNKPIEENGKMKHIKSQFGDRVEGKSNEQSPILDSEPFDISKMSIDDYINNII